MFRKEILRFNNFNNNTQYYRKILFVLKEVKK